MAPAKWRPSTAEAQLGEAPVAEAEHKENPAQWKWNVKKTQGRGSDKKPIMLETRTAKNELSRKLTRLRLRFVKTSG